jgi:hypothetical protein
MAGIDPLPPRRVVLEIERFCRAVRHGEGGVYSALLRENVLEVIRLSFPAFAARLGPVAVEEFASSFMREHGATLPRFHELATEVLIFAQDTEGMDETARCLLEYEWSLLAAEIDDRCVPPRSASPPSLNDPDTGYTLNPTLRIVALPFAIHAVDRERIAGEKHVYGVYRSPEHVVISQAFDRLDAVLLGSMGHGTRPDVGVLQNFFPGESSADLATSWLNRSIENGLVLEVGPSM